MDILAHAAWAGIAAVATSHRFGLDRRTIVATALMAAVPDLVHLMPIVGWVVFGDGTLAALQAYAWALPGQEPPLPQSVALLSHHGHCVAHSAIVAAAVGLVVWAATRTLWFPLWGWWLHIVLDVPTHSAEYYAVPVLYPFTERGFDGLAWNTPWFMVLNYAALGLACLWLIRRNRAEART